LTNLFHFLGCNFEEVRALVLKSSINKFVKMGERGGAHRNTTSLFIELTLGTKESRGEVKASQLGRVFISDTINDINCFLDGDFGV